MLKLSVAHCSQLSLPLSFPLSHGESDEGDEGHGDEGQGDEGDEGESDEGQALVASSRDAPGMGLQDAYCRGMGPLRDAYPEGDGGREEAQEGDEGHVSWQGVIGACSMGLAPACGRFHIVVERKPEDAAESLSLRTNSRCMPTDLSI